MQLPHESARAVMLIGVAKAVPNLQREEDKARLAALVAHLETRADNRMNRSLLAERLGLDRSTISNALVRGVSPGLKLALERVIGVSQGYWTARERPDPAIFVVAGPPAPHRPPSAEADGLRKITRLATKHGAPPTVLGALAVLDVPPDADPWWWCDQLLSILATHAKVTMPLRQPTRKRA